MDYAIEILAKERLDLRARKRELEFQSHKYQCGLVPEELENQLYELEKAIKFLEGKG